MSLSRKLNFLVDAFMNHAPVNMTAITGLFNTQSTRNQRRKSTLATRQQLKMLEQCKILPFALLILAEQALAAEKILYFTETATQTPAMMIYEENNFPSLAANMINYCEVMITQTPQAVYEMAGTLGCVLSSGSSPSELDKKIEVGYGYTLSDTLRDCLSQLNDFTCKAYDAAHYGTQAPESHNKSLGAAGIVFLCIALCCIVGCCFAVNQRKRRVINLDAQLTQPLPQAAYGYGYGYEQAYPPVCPTTIIAVNDYPDQYPHHHHDSDHHHSHQDQPQHDASHSNAYGVWKS